MKRIQFAMIGLLMAALISSLVPRANAQSCDDGCPQPTPRIYESAWFGTEYLLWQTSGMKLPPLVTANPLGTDIAEAGVIGVPSTSILVGNDTILDNARSGIRLSGGVNFCCGVGVEGDYFSLEEARKYYGFNANSNRILGRPFINLAPLLGPIRWDTQLINFPPGVAGAVSVHAFSKFQGAGARLRVNLLSREKCVYGLACDGGCDGCCDAITGCCPRKVKCSSLDMTIGYRYLDLDEGILIQERVITIDDDIRAYDAFDAASTFHGLELGADYTCYHKSVALNLFGRLGVGANQNRVAIHGRTAIDGVVEPERGGILAQASNIGRRDHTVASLMAQLGLKADVCLTKCLYASIGYSFLYWGNVVRPGEQIDVHVNPDLFPPIQAPYGTIGALPTHKTSDFYAHGLNVGLTLHL